MKYCMTALCLFGLMTGLASAQNDKPEKKDPAAKKDEPKSKSPFKTNREKVSYGLGLNIGRNISKSIEQDELNVDFDLLVKGLVDAFRKAEPQMQDDAFRAAMLEYQKELKKAKLESNAAFLTKNGKEKGVVTTKSGLQYVVLKEGKGESPKKTDTVKTHYRGTLLNGTEFDSSYKRKQPATFPVNGVIKGWTEALQLMKVGAKYKLYVPSELAYGENPRQGSPIRPNSVLIFEVELLEIVK